MQFLALSLCAALLWSCMRDETQSLTGELDKIMGQKEVYNEIKEKKIDELRRMLTLSKLSPEQEYEINFQLYDQFRKYRLDSAITYTRRNLDIAHELESERQFIHTNLLLAQLYSFSGMSLEAKAILDSLEPSALPEDLLVLYYETCCKFYQHYAALSGQNSYLSNMSLYRDSLLMVADPSSFAFKINKIYSLFEKGEIDTPETMLADMLSDETINTPHYAEITFAIGRLYKRKGDNESEKKYYMLSAIADISNAIKENASFHALANIYYDEGNISRANKYAQSAIEDARFSNLQFRTVQMTKFYSIVSASFQTEEANAKSKLQQYLMWISVLSAILVLSFIYLYVQNRRLYGIKEKLSQANSQLTKLNDEMNEINEQLSDSNVIKEQYIAHFFDLCSMYIDKMESNRRSLLKITQNRQFEELYKQLKSTSMLQDELDELYKNFDAIFLNLYPTFVTDFNALLTDDEQIVLKSDDLLNKELRIFALLRLGITDSVKIAAFLRCSLSTVYNYRTKVRNKAAISKEEFEKRVMKIGVVHKSKN